MRWERGHDPIGPTWTAIDNRVVDDDVSCRALGLLTRWIRRPPGVEIDSIPEMVKRAKREGKKGLEGRDALYAASYELETAGYLVRTKERNARGQHEWVVRVYASPVPPEQRSDPAGRERVPKKPRTRKHQVSPDTGFQEPDNPYPGFPDTGNPDSGGQGFSSKDSSNDSSLSEDPSVTAEEEREKEAETGNAAGPADEPQLGPPEQRAAGDGDVAAVLSAYTDAMAPTRPTQRTLARMRKDASELLDLNWPVTHLSRLAGELPGKGYSSLARHAEYNPPPNSTPQRTAPPADRCQNHPAFEAGDCPPCRRARMTRPSTGLQPAGKPSLQEMLAAARAGTSIS